MRPLDTTLMSGGDAPLPVDEELPPDPPTRAPTSKPDCDANLRRLREFFASLGSGDASEGLLAMLNPPNVFKAGVVSRALLADLCGYASELEFFEESQKLATTSADVWFATSDKVRGGWVIWCDRSSVPEQTRES